MQVFIWTSAVFPLILTIWSDMFPMRMLFSWELVWDFPYFSEVIYYRILTWTGTELMTQKYLNLQQNFTSVPLENSTVMSFCNFATLAICWWGKTMVFIFTFNFSLLFLFDSFCLWCSWLGNLWPNIRVLHNCVGCQRPGNLIWGVF